jgi:hypothetical protein
LRRTAPAVSPSELSASRRTRFGTLTLREPIASTKSSGHYTTTRSTGRSGC